MAAAGQSARAKQTKKHLAERIQANWRQLSEWYHAQARQAPPPFYCSVDLRDSGFKIVPVDSNLYPAGFNNICPEDLRDAPRVIRTQVEATAGLFGIRQPRRILDIPESHTQNVYYAENLYYLTRILEDAGFGTRLGWYGPLPEGSGDSVQLTSQTGKTLTAHRATIDGGAISAGGFVPDLVLLNNDFSSGYPDLLDHVKQPILPSHALGWHSRKKSDHFIHYNRLAREFAGIAGFDPWLIQIDTEEVDDVLFDDNQGVEQVAQSAERVLERTRRAYEQHHVSQKPFVFVKNNSGTYGMGIMVVYSPDELRQMNRRTKHKMSIGKNRLAIRSVAVQEGVPTATIVDRLAAEPVIYLTGGELIGGFLRTNTEKGAEENLNSQGMVFRKLCMSDLRRSLEEDEGGSSEDFPQGPPILELVYGATARISTLATGVELSLRLAKSA